MQESDSPTMRKILLLIVLILSGASLSAQNTFEKVIDTLGCAGASCIQETFDGGYVFCGQSSYNGNDVIIVKLDSIGTIEWAKTYSGASTEAATYIEQTPDSGYMVNAFYDSGSPYGKNWLLRLDINGDTLWTQIYSLVTGATNPSQNNSMTSISNSLYSLTGYLHPVAIANTSAYFIATIGNGFLLSSKIYSSAYGTESRSIDRTFDDGFIMAGVIAASSSTADIYLIRTNSLGDTIWTRNYDRSHTDAAMDVKQTVDSGFIIAAIIYDTTVYKYNIYLVKTDTLGDTLWTKQFFSPFEQVAHSIQQTIDGGYIMTGYANTAVGRSLYLIKTNSTGDTLWTRMFNANIDNSAFFIRQTKDGGFIISGISYGAYIIKTDSMGMVATITGKAELNNPFSLNIYPNPTTGIFTLEAKGIPKHNSIIKIYSVINECVYSGRINNNVTEQIDLSNLPDGMYVIVLNANSKLYQRKIIIKK